MGVLIENMGFIIASCLTQVSRRFIQMRWMDDE